MAYEKVFYSWESDRPNETNREFIEDCIKEALLQVNVESKPEIELAVDRDAQGISGTPDISAEVFKKISSCWVFVADLTFVDDGNSSRRRFPNPNVLVELGYALAVHDWAGIICVVNEAFGKVTELPFDISRRRVVRYSLGPNHDPSQAKLQLTSELANQFATLIAERSNELAKEYDDFIQKLRREIVTAMIYGDQVQSRAMEPGLSDMKTELGWAAKNIRELALNQVAADRSVRVPLEELAELLEAGAEFIICAGDWDNFVETVRAAIDKAKSMFDMHCRVRSLDRKQVTEATKSIALIARKVRAIRLRVSEGLTHERLNGLQRDAEDVGLEVLHYAYRSHVDFDVGFSSRLREAGQPLHLMGAFKMYGNENDISEFRRVLDKSANALEEVVAELS